MPAADKICKVKPGVKQLYWSLEGRARELWTALTKETSQGWS